MNKEVLNCPKCQSSYIYPMGGDLYCCPDCGYEGNPLHEITVEENQFIVKDAYGNILQDGDTIMIIKDLPIKGSSKTLKSGTKAKNIRLVEDDHNINCKIDGFGAMALKSEFVKKV